MMSRILLTVQVEHWPLVRRILTVQDPPDSPGTTLALGQEDLDSPVANSVSKILHCSTITFFTSILSYELCLPG